MSIFLQLYLTFKHFPTKLFPSSIVSNAEFFVHLERLSFDDGGFLLSTQCPCFSLIMNLLFQSFTKIIHDDYCCSDLNEWEAISINIQIKSFASLTYKNIFHLIE